MHFILRLYLCHFSQSFQHKGILSVSCIHIPWHQTEADVQRMILSQRELLTVDQRPVIWNTATVCYRILELVIGEPFCVLYYVHLALFDPATSSKAPHHIPAWFSDSQTNTGGASCWIRIPALLCGAQPLPSSASRAPCPFSPLSRLRASAVFHRRCLMTLSYVLG